MRPVTDAFLRTIRGSHRMVAEARIVDPGQTGIDPDGTVISILDGDVKLDATADIRSTVDLTTDGTRAWSQSGLFTPYGPELWIRRGVEFGSGAREWVSLGYHKVYGVEQDEPPDGPLRLEGRDRMSLIKDARMLSPRQFTKTATVNNVFTTLVHEVLPLAVMAFDFDPLAVTVGRTVVVEEDRYAALLDVARSLGKVMFWDHAGVLQVKDAPDPTVPVFEVNSGANGVMVSMARSMSRDGIYNAVVASGEAGDDKPPVRSVARDMNPLSPTFWAGDFGKVPRFYSSPLLTSTGAAASAARALLARSLGRPFNIDLTLVPNPALEPLDPIRIRHRDGSDVHLIETIDVPLTAAGIMSATTKEQTGLNIETGDLS